MLALLGLWQNEVLQFVFGFENQSPGSPAELSSGLMASPVSVSLVNVSKEEMWGFPSVSVTPLIAVTRYLRKVTSGRERSAWFAFKGI